MEKNYVIDPNKVMINIPCMLENELKMFKTSLGLIKVTKDNIEFHFNKYHLGSEIITSRSEINKLVYDYLDNYSKTQLTLRELINDSLIEICNEPYKEELQEVIAKTANDTEEILYKKVEVHVDYDLSLNNLDKTTIINMLTEETK